MLFCNKKTTTASYAKVLSVAISGIRACVAYLPFVDFLRRMRDDTPSDVDILSIIFLRVKK